MDGLTAIRKLRELETKHGRPRLPALSVTGNARDAQMDACREAGFDGVVIKVRCHRSGLQDLAHCIDAHSRMRYGTSSSRSKRFVRSGRRVRCVLLLALRVDLLTLSALVVQCLSVRRPLKCRSFSHVVHYNARPCTQSSFTRIALMGGLPGCSRPGCTQDFVCKRTQATNGRQRMSMVTS